MSDAESTINRVTIEFPKMTVVIYPASQDVHILYLGGFPSESCTLAQFATLLKTLRAKQSNEEAHPG